MRGARPIFEHSITVKKKTTGTCKFDVMYYILYILLYPIKSLIFMFRSHVAPFIYHSIPSQAAPCLTPSSIGFRRMGFPIRFAKRYAKLSLFEKVQDIDRGWFVSLVVSHPSAYNVRPPFDSYISWFISPISLWFRVFITIVTGANLNQQT